MGVSVEEAIKKREKSKQQQADSIKNLLKKDKDIFNKAVYKFENREPYKYDSAVYKFENREAYRYNNAVYKFEHRNDNNTSYHTEDRGIIDRIFGMLGYNGIVEGLYNLTDNDDSTTFGQGLIEGLKNMNPLEDDVTQRNTFSDVLRNLGWEDKEDGKANVGRGIAGFVGDVLLDPLSFLNPYSSAAKVVKGTGVALKDVDKVRKAVKAAEVSGKMKDSVSVGSKINKLTNLTLDDAKKIVSKNNPHYSAERVEAEAIKVLDGYASKVRKVTDSDKGEGFVFGLSGVIPFSNKIKIGDKTLDSFSKQFISSEKLRALGDKTIAPYYNSLASKIRTSKIGGLFSNNNKFARLEKTDGVIKAFNKYYLNYLNSGMAKAADNMEDIKNSEIISKFFEDNPDYTHDDFIRDIEDGVYDAYLEMNKIRADVAERYAKRANISNEEREIARKRADELRNRTNNLRTFIDEAYEYTLDEVTREKYTNADMVINRKQSQFDSVVHGTTNKDLEIPVDDDVIDVSEVRKYDDDELYSRYQSKRQNNEKEMEEFSSMIGKIKHKQDIYDTAIHNAADEIGEAISERSNLKNIQDEYAQGIGEYNYEKNSIDENTTYLSELLDNTEHYAHIEEVFKRYNADINRATGKSIKNLTSAEKREYAHSLLNLERYYGKEIDWQELAHIYLFRNDFYKNKELANFRVNLWRKTESDEWCRKLFFSLTKDEKEKIIDYLNNESYNRVMDYISKNKVSIFDKNIDKFSDSELRIYLKFCGRKIKDELFRKKIPESQIENYNKAARAIYREMRNSINEGKEIPNRFFKKLSLAERNKMMLAGGKTIKSIGEEIMFYFNKNEIDTIIRELHKHGKNGDEFLEKILTISNKIADKKNKLNKMDDSLEFLLMQMLEMSDGYRYVDDESVIKLIAEKSSLFKNKDDLAKAVRAAQKKLNKSSMSAGRYLDNLNEMDSILKQIEEKKASVKSAKTYVKGNVFAPDNTDYKELSEYLSFLSNRYVELEVENNYYKTLVAKQLEDSLKSVKNFKKEHDLAKTEHLYEEEQTMYDILRMEDEIAKMEKSAGRKTLEDMSVFVDREMAEKLLYTNDVLDRAKELGEDAEKAAIFKIFTERMKKAADEELSVVYNNSPNQSKVARKFSNKQHSYMMHVLTEEGKEYFTDPIIKETGKFNPSEYGSKKKFDKARRFKTIEEGEKWFSKALAREYHKSLIDSGMTTKEAAIYFKENYDWDAAPKMYIHNVADIYLERAIGSNELLYSTNVNNFVKNSLCTKYDGTVEKDRVVGSYKDINDGLLKGFSRLPEEERTKYRNFREYRNEALEKAGIPELMFADNLAFLDLTEEQAKTLSKYCSKNRPVELYNMDDYVFSQMNKYTREQLSSIQSGVVKLFDSLQTQWKLLNTIIMPGFHIQNAVSNAFQSFLGVGADAFNPKKIKLAYNIVRTGDPKQTVILNGTKYTYKELAEAIKTYKVSDNTFFDKELSAGKHKFPLYRAGTFIGSNIENIQRVNIFLSLIDQGKSFEEAAEGVNKFLFDYADLTDFEKGTLKRIIPFYTFMRKNLPLMFEQMFLVQPNTFNILNKAITSIEEMNEDYVDENHRNPYRQDYIQLLFNIEGDSYGIANQLPYTQPDRIFNLQQLAGQTSPLIKTPIELLTGRNIYTGMPTGNILEYAAQQFPFSKITANSLEKDAGTERNLYILGQLAGFPINKINPMVYYNGEDYWQGMYDIGYLDLVKQDMQNPDNQGMLERMFDFSSEPEE